MVQIKEMLKNFIPSTYKKVSRKSFTSKSFLSIIGAFVFILGILFLFSISLDMKETLNTSLNDKLIYVSYGTICANLVGLVLFRKEKLQKFVIIIPYITCILMFYIIMAIGASMTDNPVSDLKLGMVGSNLLWIIGVLINTVLVWKSVKTSHFKIRDKYANYFMNSLSIAGIIFFFVSKVINNFTYAYTGMVFLIATLQILATFHFPRVLRYWKKEPKNENASIYGNSIEMIKNKRTKK